VVLIPMLMFGFGGIATKVIEKTTKETVPVVLVGEENDAELARRIRAVARFEFVEPPADLRAAIGEKRIRAAIEIPAGFADDVAAGLKPELKVLYHEGEPRSESSVNDVRKTASEYSHELLARRLAQYGLGPDDLEPFKVDAENVASKEQVTGRAAGGILLYIIIIMCVVGAIYPAIDLTAGEKERGTMETILASSVGRLDLVVGKFLTVMSASVSTAVLSLASIAFTGAVIVPRLLKDSPSGGLRDLVEMVRVSPIGLVTMFVLLLPLTVLFAAVLMSVALLAKSYREAQSYVGPLPMFAIVPAMLGMLPGIELTPTTALIPITSISLASKELLAGSFPWTSLGIIFVSTCAYAVVALLIAVGQFHREEVLFRT